VDELRDTKHVSDPHPASRIRVDWDRLISCTATTLTGCPESPKSLTAALVNTKHNPARLPPATAHPIPCSQITLASSALAKMISILLSAIPSNLFHALTTLL
jgi:hypothetical protein